MGLSFQTALHGLLLIIVMTISTKNLDKKQYPEAFYWLGVAALMVLYVG
ncbi:hypothetical protein KI809_18810 [Geobacter pelophilus]|uniref:Uncharacterized protein n=1 Tax=Geoanaerobacter pelophilus TaxID=60036 RepID=A0AAW4L564_9BACT|nr:hypothetical protein [Geoanaerobacter pelophilus]MBT0666364.1 hypothetical protein [Geoanaerobacter pelophilus]